MNLYRSMACKEINPDLSSDEKDLLYRIEYGLIYEIGMARYRKVKNNSQLNDDQKDEAMVVIYNETLAALKELRKEYGK